MNKPLLLTAAIGLLSAALGGCAPHGRSAYNSYGGGYGGYGGHGYSQSSQKDREKETRDYIRQERSVKALQEAAKNGADPASTLYQQMLINQGR